MRIRMRKSRILTFAAAFILAACMTIPAASIAPAYAEDSYVDYGTYVESVEGIHIKNDGLSTAEILKYEAAFKQAFGTVVIENRSNGLVTFTIKTNKFTFEGKEMYISGIDAFVIKTGQTDSVGISMNVVKDKDGCPSSFSYTPVITLIRVDFPAPFSPIRACISPSQRVKSTAESARTPGKLLCILCSSNTAFSFTFCTSTFLSCSCLVKLTATIFS